MIDKINDGKYYYVVTSFRRDIVEFARRNHLYTNKVIWVNTVERICGLGRKSIVLYVLDSATGLREYREIIMQAKIREFEIKDIMWR